MVLGGGFGGLYAATHLQRLLPKEQLHLTLVNRDNHFLFTPMLHEVAASDLDVTTIVSPIRKLLRGGSLFVGQATAVDLKARRVSVAHADGGHGHDLRYDHLVIALGSVTNYFGLPGLRERALTMKSLGDAIALRNRVIERLEQADFECAAAERSELLTFVVAGAGFAGVETVGAMHDFLLNAIPFYPNLSRRDLRVVLVSPGLTVLPELSPDLGAYTVRQLTRRGIEVRLGSAVKGVTDQGVDLSDGSTIPARTLVWTAGVSTNPLVASLALPAERGRITTNPYLQVPGWPGVWAVGDCASIPDPSTNSAYPPTAQHAVRQGRVLARNIAASIKGGELTPFRFKTLGQLAAIGRRSGVANVMGMNFSGFTAWWLWRTIYLSKLPRLERKLRVALDWTLDLFFSKDLVQLNTATTGGVRAGRSAELHPAASPRDTAGTGN